MKKNNNGLDGPIKLALNERTRQDKHESQIIANINYVNILMSILKKKHLKSKINRKKIKLDFSELNCTSIDKI